MQRADWICPSAGTSRIRHVASLELDQKGFASTGSPYIRNWEIKPESIGHHQPSTTNRDQMPSEVVSRTHSFFGRQQCYI